MALRSKLFSGDSRLEAAAVSDPAHIMRGAKGDHVAKIQMALVTLDGATIAVDADFGSRTAAAVLAYKQKRKIINPAYQTQADDIVGRMTVARMDEELAALEVVPPVVRPISIITPLPQPYTPPRSAHPRLLIGFAIGEEERPKGLQFKVQEIRLEPRGSYVATVLNGLGGTVEIKDQTPMGNIRDETTTVWDSSKGPYTWVQNLPLRSDIADLLLFGYRVGDSLITATAGNQTDTLKVIVRAPKVGPKPGAPPKIADPKSDGLVTDDNSEPCPPTTRGGRPINPLQGAGRNINVGGEQETPGFEDYTANLPYSGYARSFTNGDVFRPFISDPVHGVASGGALNICMRGTPFKPAEADDVVRMAGARCRLTFVGGDNFAEMFKGKFGGRQRVRYTTNDGSTAMVLERGTI